MLLPALSLRSTTDGGRDPLSEDSVVVVTSRWSETGRFTTGCFFDDDDFEEDFLSAADVLSDFLLDSLLDDLLLADLEFEELLDVDDDFSFLEDAEDGFLLDEDVERFDEDLAD